MTDDEKAALIALLKLSHYYFKDIKWEYSHLTVAERQLVSREEFETIKRVSEARRAG